MQGARDIKDDVVWDYSKTTQNTVELIGSCKHGKEAFEYFKKGFKKTDLPQIMFEGRSWKDIPYEKLSPRLKKIAEIEQEDSDSPDRGKNGAFRKRPYE